VEKAFDGIGALESARTRYPDVIVSDVCMPRMDGLDLCREIRADDRLKETPVLLLSGVLKDSESAVAGLRAGADDYLELPYDPMRLVAKVARLSERRRAERDSQVEQRALFAALADLVLIFDADGLYLKVAPTRADMLFKSDLGLAGRRLHQVFPREQADFFLSHIRRALASGQPHSLEYALKINGVERWFETTVSPLSSKAVYWVARDVTDRKDLHERFLQSQKMEAVGRLAGGIAHDFNNLLTAITGFGDLVVNELAPESQVRRDAEEVLQAAARAAALTRQLLAFSRKQVLQPTVLDLNIVVANLEPMLRRLIGEDIDFRTTLPAGIGHVHADPGQLEQVLLNLVVNARDAMPDGGTLSIHTDRVMLDQSYAEQHPPATAGEYVMLAVSDTGTGLDENVRAHLFEPFFTTKEPGKGTGLGLATVYGIIQQSGGHVWVYSEKGQGTTFKIYLPRVPHVKGTLENALRASARPRGTETVLLVEDNPQVRGLAQAVLARSGYTVLAAGDGVEAIRLALAHEKPIHALVTDVVMPGMGGRALAEHIRSTHPGLRVLYMSGYPDESIVHRGVLEPGTPFLEKPFTPQSLAKKLRDLLDDETP
jgi:two-component system cell cycle sensor histidine kinase/response regulator CckA